MDGRRAWDRRVLPPRGGRPADRAAATRHGDPARVVVWEHNSHVGDARATEMGRRRDELNVGQLAREHWPGSVALVGVTTYEGTVTAASSWDAPAERKRVHPALPNSYEALFHEVGEPRFLVDLTRGQAARSLKHRCGRSASSTGPRPSGRAPETYPTAL